MGLSYHIIVRKANITSLGNVLSFQYLVHVFKGDFRPRNSVYEITELDVSKTSAADMQGSTTRADGES
ncbi:unnamed protein product [Prunus armeniaca]|uniref:Uncharacterized protein n=1 Tax=Prunus armeniaca TaxID=36596 RepID=A0A6J5XF25_PRUAR|nr:unnamed protein product [Prunus armeniaca]CAB4312450.1 unnamed protein product [Prunus armeniaca]